MVYRVDFFNEGSLGAKLLMVFFLLFFIPIFLIVIVAVILFAFASVAMLGLWWVFGMPTTIKWKGPDNVEEVAVYRWFKRIG